jgi:hypothetical protein
MSTKQQRGNRSIQPRAGFWPFNPEGPPGKETGSLGDKTGSTSIKNYPSSPRGPFEKVGNEKQASTRKRVTKR